MNNLKLVAALFAALGLVACGGGSGLGGGPAASAVTNLSGSVKTAATQSGVAGVTVAAAGRTSVSSSDGSFDLGDVPAERIEIRIESDGITATITIDVSGGGNAELDIEISDDGVIVRIHMDRCDGDDSEVEARETLVAVVEGLEGHIEVESEDDGDQKIEVEVEGLESGQEIAVSIVNGDGIAQTIGTATANERGRAEVEIETSDGQFLPFEAETVNALEGFDVVVRDADSEDVLLEGTVPALESDPQPCDDDESDDDDDDRDSDDDDDESDDDDDHDSDDDDESDDDHDSDDDDDDDDDE